MIHGHQEAHQVHETHAPRPAAEVRGDPSHGEARHLRQPPAGRPFTITFETEEFTCLCPLTGQPDFAKLRILYQPDQLCVESKSLKLYLWSFRDQGAFHEAVTNQILDDLVKATKPQWMRIEGDFLIRGGIRTLVVAEHGNKK